MDVIVGIDLGTTACKVTVVRDDLTTHSVSSSPYRISAPRRGWAEQTPSRGVGPWTPHCCGHWMPPG
jgi:sugar (pentulose or hexulose) kinase